MAPIVAFAIAAIDARADVNIQLRQQPRANESADYSD